MPRRLIIAVLCALSFGCSKKTASVKAEASAVASLPAPPPAPPPPPRAPTLAERLAAQKELWAAISVTKPHFGDGGLTPGAAALAVWSASNIKWPELEAIPETKIALVMKDAEAEIGKRICASGSIVEISVDRSSGEPVYLGGLVTPGMKVVRFAAVRSTGELVQNSQARFCGIVTGKESYANSGGGTTHAVFAVGMFDLPENKARRPVAATE